MNYHEKEMGYFGGCRNDLITLVSEKGNNLRVLEIGAGTGATLAQLKERGIASFAVGVDIMDLPDPRGIKNLIDDFLIGDLEKLDLSRFDGSFDIIIAGDVLEHLIDPWKIVEKLKTCLRNKGYFIASIPNIAHHTVLRNLIFKQQFTYDPQGGIMDITHFRFFAKENMVELFERSGLKVEKIQSVQAFHKQSSLLRKMAMLFTFGRAEPLFATQYLIEAKNV